MLIEDPYFQGKMLMKTREKLNNEKITLSNIMKDECLKLIMLYKNALQIFDIYMIEVY